MFRWHFKPLHFGDSVILPANQNSSLVCSRKFHRLLLICPCALLFPQRLCQVQFQHWSMSSYEQCLPCPIHTSLLQNTAVRSTTSTDIGSILSSDGVAISSGYSELSCNARGYCSRWFPAVLKPLLRAQGRSPWEPRGYAELRTEILAMDVRKAECPLLSSKNRAARAHWKDG